MNKSRHGEFTNETATQSNIQKTSKGQNTIINNV